MKIAIKEIGFAVLIYVLQFSAQQVVAQKTDSKIKPDSAYQDLTHESNVFGHKKFYRLYVPDNYLKSSKKYPVIYFFHGWGGRHFKDDNANLEYKKLKELVNKYQVMMVMWDGSMDGKEPRPYNIGYHEDIKFRTQMKDYFPELINHIDEKYRTLTDRNHRGIIGFSMGGIMSLFLSGKYPDKVCAAVSLTGSPEFFIGYPENHTLYQIRYTFKNLQDIDTRIHTSSTDILYNLNEEVYQGAAWEGKTLEFENFPGGHMVDKKGETVIFEKAMKFVADSFKKPHKSPQVWSHYDLYPDFGLWGYTVESDKSMPGFIFLKNVSKKGFGLETHQWLPAGPKVPIKKITVSTAPVYKPDYQYDVVKYSAKENTVLAEKMKTDAAGKLKFIVNGGGYQIGINDKTAKPNWSVVDYQIETESSYLQNNSANKLTVRLLNRGGLAAANQTFNVKITARDKAITLKDSVLTFKADPANRLITLAPIELLCAKQLPQHADPSEVKLIFEFPDDNSKDELTVPVRFDAGYFKDTKVDDGIVVRGKSFGNGNADGVVNPGEKVLLYEGKNRLRLYTEDRFVIKENEILVDEIIPARWPDGYTQISVIHISPDCPDGHKIECLASYETKTFNPIERKLNWGKVSFTVHKKTEVSSHSQK